MNYRRNAKHETREALTHFRVTWQRSYCSVDGKGYSKGRNFSCDHEALFTGQHKELEVDVSEFRVDSVTLSWNKIYIFCSLLIDWGVTRKHFWERYGDWVIGSWCKPIRSKVSNSDQTLPSFHTDRCKVRKHQGKTADFHFVFVHNTTPVEVLELWVLRAIPGLLEERFAPGR